jgi:hypothetical protein
VGAVAANVVGGVTAAAVETPVIAVVPSIMPMLSKTTPQWILLREASVGSHSALPHSCPPILLVVLWFAF